MRDFSSDVLSLQNFLLNYCIILNKLKFKGRKWFSQGHRAMYLEEARLKHKLSWRSSDSCPAPTSSFYHLS